MTHFLSKKKKIHLLGLAAGWSQQERVQDIFSSQEEAVTVLIQEDGGDRELTVMAAEDGGSVGGQKICKEGRDKNELQQKHRRGGEECKKGKGGIKKINEFKLHSSFIRKSLHKDSEHETIQIKRTG